VPRVPLPDVGVTSIRETCTASSKVITPRSSLLQTHSSIPCGSPLLRPLASFVESSQVATSPCYYRDYPDVISANPSSDARAHTLAVCWVLSRFFPSIHRPSPSFDWVSFPLPSVNTTFHGSAFEVAAISLCSGLRVCSPPRSFLPLQVPLQGSRGFFTSEQNVRRYLRTHRTCYPPDHRQLAERELSSRKIRSLVGCYRMMPTFPPLPLKVGSRTDATLLRSDLSVAPRFLWECLTNRIVSWFSVPAASNRACPFRALGFPACFLSRFMWPIGLERLSVVARSTVFDSH